MQINIVGQPNIRMLGAGSFEHVRSQISILMSHKRQFFIAKMNFLYFIADFLAGIFLQA
jgi:hypothetical protein